jgi:L-serine dehydratase
MQSIRELYRIGHGPSSSHTMGPRNAAELFLQRYPTAVRYAVTLYGSLAATGKGHLTDKALHAAFAPKDVEIIWKPQELLPIHPNGMAFRAIFADHSQSPEWQIYSLGGGAIGETPFSPATDHYPHKTLTAVMEQALAEGTTYWEYVLQQEDPQLFEFLAEIWQAMQASIAEGLQKTGELHGGLGVQRKAKAFYEKAFSAKLHSKRQALLSAYALAVSEQNASGGRVVTAPTCGACGIVPATLRYLQEEHSLADEQILQALATAGLIGNFIKHNASISGAQVGCQGEVGAACSMAAGAAVQLLGGDPRQIEYAAAMALEHYLGLTCDPVKGLVQIPCIERNAFAANRAVGCAEYALFTDGTHLIPFDEVVAVMWETGTNLPSLYRETSLGGLAAAYQRRSPTLQIAENPCD